MLMMSDPSEIEIVLDNLIGNSLKFSAPRDAPEIRITAGLDSGDMVVHVSDNGVGITADDLCRIFEPFTRCHPGFQGSGLGLTLARHIVVRHGGRIWATGESGHGTTISFSS
jgi:signal transduction histidine kinase